MQFNFAANYYYFNYYFIGYIDTVQLNFAANGNKAS